MARKPDLNVLRKNGKKGNGNSVHEQLFKDISLWRGRVARGKCDVMEGFNFYIGKTWLCLRVSCKNLVKECLKILEREEMIDNLYYFKTRANII